MKRNKLSIALLFALSANVVADEQATPKVYGTLDVHHEWLDNGTDDGVRVGKASIGVKGPLKYGNFTAIYDIDLELSDLANPDNASDANEARVRTARVVIPGKWGAIVAGRTYSGQRADIYGHLDIFNNTERYNLASGGYTQSSSLTNQPLYAPGVLAYKSPSFGGLYGVVAALSVNDTNGKSTDASAARLVYKKGSIKVGAGIVNIDESLLPGADDYVRTAIGASYTVKKWHVGGTIESNKDHPSGDFDVTAVAGSFKPSAKTALKLGYYNKAHDSVAALDNKATIANVSYLLGGQKGKSATMYLEHEKHDLSANDRSTVGISLKF